MQPQSLSGHWAHPREAQRSTWEYEESWWSGMEVMNLLGVLLCCDTWSTDSQYKTNMDLNTCSLSRMVHKLYSKTPMTWQSLSQGIAHTLLWLLHKLCIWFLEMFSFHKSWAHVSTQVGRYTCTLLLFVDLFNGNKQKNLKKKQFSHFCSLFKTHILWMGKYQSD